MPFTDWTQMDFSVLFLFNDLSCVNDVNRQKCHTKGNLRYCRSLFSAWSIKCSGLWCCSLHELLNENGYYLIGEWVILKFQRGLGQVVSWSLDVCVNSCLHSSMEKKECCSSMIVTVYEMWKKYVCKCSSKLSSRHRFNCRVKFLHLVKSDARYFVLYKK